jgi:hypothetical protein
MVKVNATPDYRYGVESANRVAGTARSTSAACAVTNKRVRLLDSFDRL